ncbi:MAG: hypothetical protein RLN78_11830 [Phycisphaerales bacterium]
MAQKASALHIVGTLLLGFCVSDASAQDSSLFDDPSSAQEAPEQVQRSVSFGEVFASVERAEPNRRAGLRSSLLSQSMQVVPIVVIVDSPVEYLDAISSWEGPLRYPILFDDGSELSREHIARFVRAFEPEQVIRVTKRGTSSWGRSAQERQDAISTALAAAIQESEPDWERSLGVLKDTGIVSPGVVVIDPMDQHWAGGLALAAGRFEPVIFLSGPQNHYKELTAAQAEGMNQSIEQGLRRLGRSYDQIGDEVDALTLAFRIGVKIKTGPQDRDRLATTDQIGRSNASLGGMRWAWSGQLFGNTSTSVYQAMCSLFLPIDSAFIWDGYPTEGQWVQYDGTETGETLNAAGMQTELFDDPRASLAGFKGRAASSPVDASLIMMNTKGSPNHYDLPHAPTGMGKPGDIPMLDQPAAMHIVHSFSLSQPFQSKTVGGRWLDRGVYLYAGSVDEPFLTGFVPTPTVARRLLGQLPFAAAIHYDDGQAWKIAVIGDPLKTLSACGVRLDSVPPIVEEYIQTSDGSVLNTRAKELLKASDFTGAIEDFVLTGEDDAVVRLGKALLADKPEAIDDRCASMIVHAAFRKGEHELVLEAFERLSIEARADEQVLDTMWMAGRYMMTRFSNEHAMVLMRTHLREGQEIQDAEELAMRMRRDSISEAVGFLESLRPTLKNQSQARALNKALERVRG